MRYQHGGVKPYAFLRECSYLSAIVQGGMLTLLCASQIPLLARYIYNNLYDTYREACPLAFEPFHAAYDGYNSTGTLEYDHFLQDLGVECVPPQDQLRNFERLEENSSWIEDDEECADSSTAKNSDKRGNEQTRKHLEVFVGVKKEEYVTSSAERLASVKFVTRQTSALMELYSSMQDCDDKEVITAADIKEAFFPDVIFRDTCESRADAPNASKGKKRLREEHAPRLSITNKPKNLGMYLIQR